MATSKIPKRAGSLYREEIQIASNLTIAANAVLGATQSVNAAKDGYRPLAIASTKSNSNQINVMRCEINDRGVIYARVSNLSSTQITGVTLSAIVLYEKL